MVINVALFKHCHLKPENENIKILVLVKMNVDTSQLALYFSFRLRLVEKIIFSYRYSDRYRLFVGIGYSRCRRVSIANVRAGSYLITNHSERAGFDVIRKDKL